MLRASPQRSCRSHPATEAVHKWLELNAQGKRISAEKTEIAKQIRHAVGDLPTAFLNEQQRAILILRLTTTRVLDKKAIEEALKSSIMAFEDLRFAMGLVAPATKTLPHLDDLTEAYGQLHELEQRLKTIGDS